MDLQQIFKQMQRQEKIQQKETVKQKDIQLKQAFQIQKAALMKPKVVKLQVLEKQDTKTMREFRKFLWRKWLAFYSAKS